MNPYEERQEAKRQRLLARAAKKEAESTARAAKGWKALDAIPFGQPILVGHHSEKADRSYRGRAVANIDKAAQLSIEAQQLQQRAASVGRGGISSDDPEAIQKLDAQLHDLQEAHATMLAENRHARRINVPIPFAAYQLTNSSANLRRIQKRIEYLGKMRTRAGRPGIIGNGWKLIEDLDENRYRFTFDAIPTEEVRALLKSRAFKWSPRLQSWVRQITPNARLAADQIRAQLPGKYPASFTSEEEEKTTE